MPIYEYHCEECNETFDKFVRSISGSIEVECPKCHSKRCRKNVSRFGTVGAGSVRGSSCAPTGG